MPNIKRFCSVALLTTFCAQANAASFEFDNFELSWDSVVYGGIQYRIQDRKKYLSQGKSGANGELDNLATIIDNAFIINSNDGNNNFDKGLTVQRVSFMTEVDFNFGDWGVFARGKFWHDFQYRNSTDMSRQAWEENNANPKFGDNNGATTTFGRHNPAARDYAESGKKLLDMFWYGSITLPNDHNISLRVGRQVISWGEALLSGGGLSTSINHVDAHIRSQPGFDIKELFLPSNAIFFQTALTDTMDLQAYYQTEFNPALIDPSGSYNSEFDSLGAGGNTFMFVSGTEERILGKDLRMNEKLYANYTGIDNMEDCLATDRNVNGSCADVWYDTSPVTRANLENLLLFLPTTCDQASNEVEMARCRALISKRVRVDQARDQGQFGIKLNYFMESGDELAFYYVNYHEKIPNFILPVDAIETFGPIIDMVIRFADGDCYFGRPGAPSYCRDADGNSYADKGGFNGVADLSSQMSIPQINALLIFLSALPEDSGTIGTVTKDLVENPQFIFNENTPEFSRTCGSDPLCRTALAAFSMGAADAFLKPLGFSTNSPVRSLNYRVEYAEDVRMLGATYSTILGTANVATEITYRDNTPLLRGDIPRTPIRSRLVNWHVNLLQVFEPIELFGVTLWDFSSFLAEVLVWKAPGKLPYNEDDTFNKKRLAVQNSPEGIGASVFWSLEYYNVFTGWDIMVPIYMNWGIDGSMFNSGYRDGQVIFATGLTFKNIEGYEIGWGMTRMFGDSDDIFQMLTQDRDNMTLHFKYNF